MPEGDYTCSKLANEIGNESVISFRDNKCVVKPLRRL